MRYQDQVLLSICFLLCGVRMSKKYNSTEADGHGPIMLAEFPDRLPACRKLLVVLGSSTIYLSIFHVAGA
jgi:hypothetical protein